MSDERDHIHPQSKDVSETMHVEANANVNVNRFTIPRGARELLIAIILSASIMVNLWVTNLYLTSQQALITADNDVKKEVRLKENDQQEQFQKFVAGPYAALAGELRANEILFQKCKQR
jgi:hypothetical protein